MARKCILCGDLMPKGPSGACANCFELNDLGGPEIKPEPIRPGAGTCMLCGRPVNKGSWCVCSKSLDLDF